jgi:hypothetical protein
MSRKPNNSNSILGANDSDHHRIRRLISNSSSGKELTEQESIIQRDIDTLIGRLQDKVRAGWGNGFVDTVKRHSWTTFDIIGELGDFAFILRRCF